MVPAVPFTVAKQPKRKKTGGRRKGTPNKATRDIQEFLTPIFDTAFRDKRFAKRLLDEIVFLRIDTKLLGLLLAYRFGKPPQKVELEASQSLAELIAGPAKDGP